MLVCVMVVVLMRICWLCCFGWIGILWLVCSLFLIEYFVVSWCYWLGVIDLELVMVDLLLSCNDLYFVIEVVC